MWTRWSQNLCLNQSSQRHATIFNVCLTTHVHTLLIPWQWLKAWISKFTDGWKQLIHHEIWPFNLVWVTRWAIENILEPGSRDLKEKAFYADRKTEGLLHHLRLSLNWELRSSRRHYKTPGPWWFESLCHNRQSSSDYWITRKLVSGWHKLFN